jgi:glycosyltransferase involved in cell wall biosynthesis
MIANLDRLIPGTGSRIRFVSPVSQAELAEWTAGATLGAILYEPVSANHVYCSPNKLWEYPRSGVPILCTDVPEMAKRVTAYGHGFMVPAETLDATTIAERINSLTDEDIAMARSACRTFIEADNWSIYAERLRTLYANLSVDMPPPRTVG